MASILVINQTSGEREVYNQRKGRKGEELREQTEQITRVSLIVSDEFQRISSLSKSREEEQACIGFWQAGKRQEFRRRDEALRKRLSINLFFFLKESKLWERSWSFLDLEYMIIGAEYEYLDCHTERIWIQEGLTGPDVQSVERRGR